MKDLIAELAIIIATTTGIVKVLDLLLNTAQKDRIRSYGDHLWLWLDQQRLGKFTGQVVSSKNQIALAILISAGDYIYDVYSIARGWELMVLGWDVLAAFAVYFIFIGLSNVLVLRETHPAVVSWLVSGNTVSSFFHRGLKLALLSTALLSLIALITYSSFQGNLAYTYGLSLSVAAILSPLTLEASLTLVIMTISGLWFVIIILLMTLFRCVQFILLRIVDYPDGPVLAVSAILAFLAAIFKSLA